MSLIFDALEKAGRAGSPTPPAPPSPPRSPWITGVVGMVVIGLGFILLGKLPSRPTSSVVSTRTSGSTATASSPSGVSLLSLAQGQWRLSGIIHGGGKSLALINDEVVEEGSTFRGARVVRVTENQVELESNGQIQTLKLP